MAASSIARPRRSARSRSTAARPSSSSGCSSTRTHWPSRERRSGSSRPSSPGAFCAVYSTVTPAARARLWKSNSAISSSRLPATSSRPSSATSSRDSSPSSAARTRPAALASGAEVGRRPAGSARGQIPGA
ncbi:hypothetical protein G6F32_015632 [Rhizopus arrhizus]|nr:hypothetical protein G6F32_015632 [Rhizopus arrhizus]